MALERGRFGIEYNPRQMEREPSGLGRVLIAVAVVALLSVSWTVVKRIRARAASAAETPVAQEPPASSGRPEPAPSTPPPTNVVPPEARTGISMRPAKVRNLLMRLEEAERLSDAEMAVSTIETIRSLPGSPAADLDDALARRLGRLNLQRLFAGKNAQWVKQVTVRRGATASRIARENGSTLASLVKLNDGACDRIVIGRQLYVMDHPRFNLVVRRRSRTADLSLNGKFFKRYDLAGEVPAKAGAHELPEQRRAFFAKLGVRLRPEDLAELELLMPAGASVLVSEM